MDWLKSDHRPRPISSSAFPLIVHHSDRDCATLINCSLFIVLPWLAATSYRLPLSPYQHSSALPQRLKRPLLNLSLPFSPSSLWAAILVLTLSASSLSLFWHTSGRDFTAFTQSIAVTSLLCSSQQNCKHFPSLSRSLSLSLFVRLFPPLSSAHLAPSACCSLAH